MYTACRRRTPVTRAAAAPPRLTSLDRRASTFRRERTFPGSPGYPRFIGEYLVLEGASGVARRRSALVLDLL